MIQEIKEEFVVSWKQKQHYGLRWQDIKRKLGESKSGSVPTWWAMGDKIICKYGVPKDGWIVDKNC
jgi:hypothetical protein